MKYIAWPKHERPREKLLQFGAQALTNSELLALFLQTGSKEKSVMEIAQELLQTFPSFSELFDASNEELCAIHGIGPAKCVILRATLELCKRYLLEQAKAKPTIRNTNAVVDYLKMQLKGQKRELFSCLLFNPDLQLLHYEVLFQGTLTQVSVYPREVVTLALQHHADSIILAHNHPLGSPNPSQADIALTELIKKALAVFEITLHDHLIVGENEVFSFAQRGLL